jgi:hypothetical protein
MPDRLAAGADQVALGAEKPVGVDLHLDAAIAENALGHDRDHVDARNSDETMKGAGL